MDDESGWRPWRVVSYLMGGAVSLPVVAGFVMLGAGVVVARSMRDIMREAWTRLPMRARSEPVEPVVEPMLMRATPRAVVPFARRDQRLAERRAESRSDAA